MGDREARAGGIETAVLCSGGLDSAVLLALAATEGRVLPVYVSVGVAWEPAETRMLERLLAAPLFAGRVEPLVRLEVSARDVYPPGHWALEGRPPAYDTADEDVYLPGRNVMLLSKAGILAASRGIPRLAVGPLAGNPFPDATPAFFGAMAHALSLGLAHSLRIDAPFLGLHKSDVIRLGLSLGVPLGLTLSCMQPADTMHCGLCSKCRERRDAFAEAGVDDPTAYSAPPPRGRGGG